MRVKLGDISMTKLERIYIVPLNVAYEATRNKRVPRAIKILRAFITRHMKADGERILLSEELNKYFWVRSIQKPPRKVKVRLVKDSGVINAYLADEKVAEKKAEPKKEEKTDTAEKKSEPKTEVAADSKKTETKKEEKKK